MDEAVKGGVKSDDGGVTRATEEGGGTAVGLYPVKI